MGVSSISGADRGVHAEYAWNWSNQSSIMRFGALVAHKIGGNAREVLVSGESASAGRVIGFALGGSTEPGLTTFLAVDGTGVTSLGVAQAPARVTVILVAGETVAEGDLLIPSGSVGALIKRPAGSTVPPVAKALQAVTGGASEMYCQAECLISGASADARFVVTGDATDTMTADYYVPKSGVHANPGAAKNTPVLFYAPAACTISNFRVGLEVAPGATKTVTFNFKKGNTAAAANAAAASVTVAIADTNTSNTNDTDSISLAAGQVLVCKVTSADVGAAEHSKIAFTVQ